jgi:hypothetical protein
MAQNIEATLEFQGTVQLLANGILDDNQKIRWNEDMCSGPIKVIASLPNNPTDTLKFLDTYAKDIYKSAVSLNIKTPTIKMAISYN